MVTQLAQTQESGTVHRGWNPGRWVAANAAGLGVAFGLFALLGGTVEALGAEHDSIIRDLSLLVAFIVGGSLFAYLRQRALLPEVHRVVRVAVAGAISLSTGFVAGFVVAGPPLDFVLGVFAVGAIAGAVEWRALRDHIRRAGLLTAISAGGWLVASAVAIVPAALFGDAIDAALGGGVAGFTVILCLIGLVAGSVGGAIDGLALRRRLRS